MSTIEEYLEWLRTKRRRSPKTIAKYREILTAFAAVVDPEHATPEDVETFANRERRGGRVPADATVALDCRVVGTFYDWAGHRHGWGNPAALAGRPRVHNANPHPVDHDVWTTLWRHPLPVDARVALGLGYYCGLRREEIVSVTVGHVDLGQRRLAHFPRKGGGTDVFDYGTVCDFLTANLPRVGDARLFERALEAATQGRESEDRLLSWQSLRPQAVNKRLPRWLASAGLAPDACTPHALRHSFVTNLLDAGAPLHVVSSLANHASPTITMRYAKISGGALVGLTRQVNIATA